MHRSGTSMVASVLRSCGVHLGGEHDLVGAAADNPRGFAEHRVAVDIDDRLLASLDAAWDVPPPTGSLDWSADELGGLRHRGAALLADLAGSSPSGHWGIKDPRLSLTLPFWRSLMGDHRVVVCVRNPLEVAASLAERNGMSALQAFRLWDAYHAAIDEELPSTHRLVVHYAAVLADPLAQVERLAAALGLETPGSAPAEVDRGDRHHRFGVAELRHVGAPPEVVERYLRLCDEAGWVEPLTATGVAVPPPAPSGTGVDPDAVTRVRLAAELALRGGHIELLQARVAELEAASGSSDRPEPTAGPAAGTSDDVPGMHAEPSGAPTDADGPAAALVVLHRLPEYDRDRGSVRVLELVGALRDAGSRLHFWALDVEDADVAADADQRRYAEHLRQLGVTVHLGRSGSAEQLVREGNLDLCLAVFWHVAARVLPLVRSASPTTAFVVDSVDLHFLREARRCLDLVDPTGQHGLDPDDGARMAAELDVYAAADRVLTVSRHEADLLEQFVPVPGSARVVPLGDAVAASPLTAPSQRRGIAFVGNFRHLPNVEAVEHLTAEVLPRMEPSTLEDHPVLVIGHGVDERVRRAADFPHVELLGQVPDVDPHLHAARVSVVPLLHGAGVKGKVVQSLLAGTPVVSTPVGVEGLELPDQGVAPVVVVQDAAGMADAVERLLADDDAWTAQRDAGLQWARAHHAPELVADAVLEALAHVVPWTSSSTAPAADAASRRSRSAYVGVRREVAESLALLPTGSCALVATGGDDGMLSGSPIDAAPFPSSDPGGELSGPELVEQLDRWRSAGWSHLVLPSIRYRWLHQHPELREWLRDRPVVHDTAECRVFDLGRVPVLVHVDDVVQDPEVARAHLRALLARSDDEVVHMPTDHVSQWVSPLLVRQPGVRSRSMVGLGAGHAVAARGERAVAALRSALEGDARALHEIRAHVDDAHPVHLLGESTLPAAGSSRARVVRLVDDEGGLQEFPDDGPGLAAPLSSVVIATRDRADLLDGCLASIEHQVLSRGDLEVVVVDDGSVDHTDQVIAAWARRVPLRRAWLPGCGRSAAKNLGIMVARGASVLLLDDDDRLLDGALDAYLAARDHLDADVATRCAVLGHTGWAPELAVTPLMHHITEVGCQLFSYPGVPAGELLDWRHFWEGRLLVDRGLLVLDGLHDPRLAYSIDVELARRIDRRQRLHVLHDRAAGGVMARAIDLDALLVRAHAKGVAQRTIVDSTPHDAELVAYCSVVLGEQLQLAADLSHAVQALRLAEVDVATSTPTLGPQAAAALDRAVAVSTALGFHGHALELPEPRRTEGAAQPAVATPDAPELSVVVPVWSLTEELAEMATRILRRVRAVASLRTEIVVIDNGSPVPTDLSGADRVVTLPNNRGVGPAWNLGASIAAAPLLCFLNSDCEVTSGWDRALAHAATDGRRVAYPYTDHGDDLGPRAPDQAGTAGWCFMLHRELFAEIGGFDESFAPAYFEDTDYWHRAWDMGVDLSPVPAAVVHHARRTTGRHAPELEQVFERNRRRYEAKHGVGRDAPPPFYSREVVEYPPSGRHRLARLRPWASDGDDRPRVFGIGLNKTGTSSLHAAVSHLGFRSVHHGGPDLAAAIRRSRLEGRPMLSDVGEHLDAFFDIEEIRQGYAQLDREHPGSKFVLSVRDVDDWVASRVRHVQHQRDLRDRGLPHGEFLDVDVPAWLAERDAHHDAVLEHFAGRPDDLLVIDVAAGQGWERLAPFLGWGRLPERPFPWENRSALSEGAATSAAERR